VEEFISEVEEPMIQYPLFPVILWKWQCWLAEKES